jgi:hypothetical protein
MQKAIKDFYNFLQVGKREIDLQTSFIDEAICAKLSAPKSEIGNSQFQKH